MPENFTHQNLPEIRENSKDKKTYKKNPRFIKIGLIGLLSLVLIFGIILLSYPELRAKLGNSDIINYDDNKKTNNQPKTSIEVNKAPEIAIVKPESLELSLSFWGNSFWGRYTNDWSQASDLKYKYPFSGLETIGKQDFEYWISGLECPITESTRTSQEQEQNLSFTCRPEYLEEAKKWFNLFTLANNHTDNMNNIDGFNKTKKYLSDAEIEYFGHYDNALDEICITTLMPAKPVFSKENSQLIARNLAKSEFTFYQFPVSFCGYHSVFRLPTETEITQIKPYSSITPTFVMPHQGKEYVNLPDQLKIDTYHSYIDQGADAVIGDHPHAVQSTEVYSDKLIAYSLGNFMFDQQFSADVTQSLGVKGLINAPFSPQLEDWQKLDPSCKKTKNCFSTAQKSKLQKPEFSIKYSMEATDNSNKLVKKSTPQTYQRVRQLAKWDALPKTIRND